MNSTQTYLHTLNTKRIAIVYDWIDTWGGAERVLLTIHDMFPHAHWYSTHVDYTNARWAESLGHIRTSFMQRVPFRHHRTLSTLLYPAAVESMDFSEYDIVISVTSSFAKGILTRPETLHVCYMLTPTRFLWIREDDYTSPLVRKLAQWPIEYLKTWDRIAAKRPDSVIGISQAVAERITDVYHTEVPVIYPPFDHTYWVKQLRAGSAPRGLWNEPYYLVVSRHKPYKKIDMAIQAVQKVQGARLLVVGKGDAQYTRKLEQMAGDRVQFMTDIPDAQLAYVYGHAQALLMPQEEDFGYAALEAITCGCAVIAYNKGGATETVKHNKTGVLYNEQTVEGLVQAIEKFQAISYTVERYIQVHSSQEVEHYGESHFRKKFVEHIRKAQSSFTSL